MYNFRESETDTIKYYPGGISAKKAEKKRKIWFHVFDAIGSLTLALVIIFLCFTFFFRAVNVNGRSMVPTLEDGDWLIVCNMKEYEQGDIVIVTQPNDLDEPLVKRVIATGGQTVDIDFRTHKVSVDGKVLEEEYIYEPTALFYDVKFPHVVEEGHLFVMGDNRNDSLDSRSSRIGDIDERYILGKAVFRILPFGDNKFFGF